MPTPEFYRLEAKLQRFEADHPVLFTLIGLGIGAGVVGGFLGMVWLADTILKALRLI